MTDLDWIELQARDAEARLQRVQMDPGLLLKLVDLAKAARRPPLGYVVGRQSVDGWVFNRLYGGPERTRAGAEQDLAAQVEEDGPAAGWQVLEVGEAQP